jgi:NNP family nitrate/nitrite transporter-like MFS transporter
MLFSTMEALPWAIVTMLIFALFLKMSNGATYSVVPFINKKSIGAVSGIVGAGGNVGAVLAGFLFASNDISYRHSLFIIGIAVAVVSVLALLLASFKKMGEPEFKKVSASEPVLAEAYVYHPNNK